MGFGMALKSQKEAVPVAVFRLQFASSVRYPRQSRLDNGAGV